MFKITNKFTLIIFLTMILLGTNAHVFGLTQDFYDNQLSSFQGNLKQDDLVTLSDSKSVLLYYDDISAVKRLENSLSLMDLTIHLMNNSVIPTLSKLISYSAIVLLSSSKPSDLDTFGEVLADYVDQGGNVIALAYSFVGQWSIGGRLNSSGYLPLIATTNINYTRIYDHEAIHPVLNGVASFNTNSSMDVTLTLNSSAIAFYRDGMAMAAIKGNIIVLNTWYGNSSYTIDNIIVNSLKFLYSLKVLIFHSSNTFANRLQLGLFKNGFRADLMFSNSIPTLAEISNYTVIIWISSSSLSDRNAMGDILADYIDQGGYFITLAYGYVGQWAIGGRLNSSEYFPFTAITNDNVVRTYDLESNHSIFRDVVYFSSDQSMNVNVSSGTIVIAYYEDGMELAAIKNNVFALNTFYALAFGDTDLIISNAIYALRGLPVPDLTAPIIVSSNYKWIYEGSTGNSISWVLLDNNPSVYTVLRDGIIVEDGLWEDGDVISYVVDGFSPGTYNFRIYAFDLNNNTSFEDVTLHVIAIDPLTITSPEDQTIIEGNIGHFISWVPTGSNLISYRIFINETEVKTGYSYIQSEIIVPLDDIVFGIYEFMLQVYDAGVTMNDTVIITVVDAITPEISNPLDIIYDEGSTGNIISWTGSDLNANYYFVTIDGIQFEQSSWASNVPITINVDGLSLGSYTFKIKIFDKSGNFASDDLMVTVRELQNPDASNGATSRKTTNFSASFTNVYLIMISILGLTQIIKLRRL